MTETLNFELVSPERKLASTEAEAVTIPGMEGDLTAMANHAPFLTNLRPGYVVVRNGSTEDGYFVTGGFAVNHMDVAPRYAGTLMGITNTAGTIPGIVGVYVTGLILEVTGSWALVFQVAAGVTLFGLVFYLLFSTGKKLFD